MSNGCTGGRPYIVKPGDTLYLIAGRYGLTVDQLRQANPQITDPNTLQIGQEICIPIITPPPGSCPGIVYVIRAGDTLYSIARRYGVTVDALIAANPGINPRNLRIGEKICIPITMPPLRPSCVILSPTDIAPNSKGSLFIEPDVNSVFAVVTSVPNPAALPGGEVYKLWIRRRGTNHYAVGVLEEAVPGYYVGRVVPDFPLAQADAVIISSEQATNITTPAGLGVAVGNL